MDAEVNCPDIHHRFPENDGAAESRDRIAKERGLSDTFNPGEIPVYEWTDDGPVARKLADFPRTALKTPYLPLPGEPALHLMDEPFDYDRHKV